MATFHVVRHAKAGSRSHWTGDDRERPLSNKGREQAEKLVSIYADAPVDSIFSSPYVRCVQTVEALAKARGLEVETSPALAEGEGVKGLYTFFADPALDRVVLCTHGDVMWELVEDLTKRRMLPAFREEVAKGSTWVVETAKGVPVRARYIPAP